MNGLQTLRNFCKTQVETDNCYPFKNEYVLWDDDTNALSVFVDENNDVCIGCETGGGMLYTYAINEDEAFAIIEHLITNGEVSLKTNDSV